jgi:hypothetical protein
VIITRRNDRRLRISATDWVKNGDRWTILRVAQDGALKVQCHATARYLDALHIAAEHLADPQMITKLDHDGDQMISELAKETAWPTLRARLLLLMTDDTDPPAELRNAAQQLELDTAGDPAAVLAWRLDDTRLHNSLAPLPWLPGLPDRIANNPDWGPYLAARAQLINDLADQVRTAERTDAPSWVVERRFLPSADLIAETQVWRAAMQVQPADLRPTGPTQSSLLARTWQHRLDKQLAAANITQDQQRTTILVKQIPNLIKDSFLPSLVDRLERLDRAGFDATTLIRSAAAKGPLPDDHPAAALWWRILDELPHRPPNNPEQPTPALARPGASRFRRELHRPTQRPRTHRPPPR